MKPGATLGLSHGFLLGVLKNDGVDFRDDINVILVAPKVTYSVVYGLMLSGLLQRREGCNWHLHADPQRCLDWLCVSYKTYQQCHRTRQSLY